MEEIPAGIGKPAIHLDNDDPEGCGCDPEECQPRRRWFNVDVFSSVDAFKGPVDVDNGNGNFGMTAGCQYRRADRFPAWAWPSRPEPRWNRQRSERHELRPQCHDRATATSREQVFTTVGMFQRITREEGAFTWGFAYDWLFDNYYSDFHFGQWRVKGAWEFDPCNEIGIQASVPEHGSTGSIFDFVINDYDHFDFKPIAQGYLYWKHTWSNDASLTGRIGVAERPGEFVFGATGRVPLTENLALTSDFSYIMPNASGGPNLSNEGSAQAQEIWNVSVGIEFVLGGFGRGSAARCQPFLPLADNGSLAVRQTNPVY